MVGHLLAFLFSFLGTDLRVGWLDKILVTVVSVNLSFLVYDPRISVKKKSCNSGTDSFKLVNEVSEYGFALVLHPYVLWLARQSYSTFLTNQK